MPLIITKFKLSVVTGFFLAVLTSGACRSSEQVPDVAKVSSPEAVSKSATATPATATHLIVAFGDSLTAGYGLADPSTQSYPALLQKRLDQGGYSYQVINAGVSGDTTAGGVRRIDWALKGDVRIVIVELGGNDALRGQPTRGIKENLASIIEAAQKRNAKVILAGMEALPNLGPEYTLAFRNVFRELAREHQVKLIPFFLEGVGGISELNQPDGIHPNVRGTEIVVDNVWRALEPMLVKE